MIKPQLQPCYLEGDRWLELAKKWNCTFEAIEVSMPGADSNKELMSWYRSCDRITSLHGKFMDVNPASPDPDYMKLGRDKSHLSCALAKELGAKNVVFHCAAFPHLRGEYLEKWATSCAEFYLSLVDKYDINIFIENATDPTPDAVKMLVRLADSPRILACLDVGHAHFSNTCIDDWFSELGDDVGYLHLSDNSGVFDDHLPLGQGTVDWEKVSKYVSGLQRDIPVTLEISDYESTGKALDFLRDSGCMKL